MPTGGHFVNVFADAETDDQKDNQLRDDDDGENLHADRFLEPTVVDQHLDHDAEAGHGQDAGEGQGLGESEAQAEVENPVGGDEHGYAQGHDHGEHSGQEIVSSQARHETGYVDFVQADKEKEI